ncbi:coiled-coil domain-containing protein 175-like [Parasteatoda tepidariorum]|uniref:coiled-coil domain-containing protein 175-like n=1 Tax=Parasteatoda tepidariorum TaxID=114398 RepID=UPI00077FAB8F|nr:uncharacterized protein LOC107447353 [Parasteatoda tepidariorum]
MSKKKKKRSKKGKKKKSSLSQLDREILNITIENLQTKIEWRREQCRIIENDIEEYQNVCNEEYEDKINSVNLLEKAIQDGMESYRNIKAAIPQANIARLKAEEDKSYDLATGLVKLRNETKSFDAQLQVLRNNLVELEAYNVESIDEKISETEEKVSVASKRDILQGLALDSSLKTILQKEMEHSFKKKIAAYQDELSSNVNSNLLRIAEETRWWENSGYILLNNRKSLEQSNALKMAVLKKLKQDIKFHSENCLHHSLLLHDRKKKLESMKTHILQLRKTQQEKIELNKKSIYLDFLIKEYEKEFDSKRQDLKEITVSEEDSEVFIKTLELKLSGENNFGRLLSEIIKDALKLIEEEVKHSILKTYGEFTKTKDILSELDTLLREATKFIYECQSNLAF